jgi:uncharacterized protein YjeT (DUF2065 family)
MEFFLCVLGMVMFVEGLPYVVFPEKMKNWIRQVLDMPSTTLRTFVLGSMLTGLLLVYLAKG